MVYTRGSSDDYDRYANFTGDAGWSWEALQPFIKGVSPFSSSRVSLALPTYCRSQLEQVTTPSDHHNTTGQIDPGNHGYSGPVGISLSGFPLEIDQKILNTSQVLPDFAFNEDMNSGSPLGTGEHAVIPTHLEYRSSASILPAQVGRSRL